MNRCCWLELGWCFGSNVNLDGIPNLGEEGGERASLRMQGKRDEAGDVELLLLLLMLL